MKMLSRKWLVLLLAYLLIVAATNPAIPNGVEASQVLTLRRKGHHSKSVTFATLGLECECCHGEGGQCTSEWEGVCSNLRCHPWKY